MAKQERNEQHGEEGNESIEQLRKRYEILNERKITAAANLATAEKELARLQSEAKSQWGTDDLPELEAKLAAMRRENEQKRSDYEKHLAEVESRLDAVEKEFKQSQ